VASSCAKSQGLVPGGDGNGGNGGNGGADASAAGGTSGSTAGGAGGKATGGSGPGGSGAAGGSAGGVGGAAGTGGTGGTATGGSGGTATGGSGGTATGGSGGTATGGSGGTATGGSGGTGGSCAIQSFDFTSCAGGWSHSGTNDDWSCGVPSSGPGGDHDGGGQLWATNLSGKANTCEDSYLESPAVDLSAYSGQALRVRFWHWHAFRTCNSGGLCGLVCTLDKSQYSGGLVEVYDGSQWHKVTPTSGYNGTKIECYSTSADAGPTCQPCAIDGQNGFGTATNGSWQYAEADISSYAVAGFKVRFRFASYDIDPFCHPNTGGWYIDDVSIAPVGCP
jgi:hypothetical protein